MSKVFYLSEIVKFAIEKEEQAYSLYKALYDQTDNEKTKELFSYLMKQEKHHKDYYAEMLSTIPEKQSPQVEENEEYQAYMDELIAASKKITPYTELDLSDLNSVLDYAMDREKDSILFYVGLKNLTPKSAHDHIDTIINEEGKHLVMLAKLR